MKYKHAEKLAQNIRQHWAERGYKVKVRVCKEPWVEGFSAGSHGVRSDLKNGYPIGYNGDKKPIGYKGDKK